MAKKIDREFISRLIDEHKRLKTKKEKTQFLNRLETAYGMSRDTFYRHRREGAVQTKKSRADKGKPRVSNPEQFQKDVRVIASIMMASSLNHRNDFNFFRNKKFNPLEMAIHIAVATGRIEKPYSVSTVRRWLNRLGLNFDAVFRKLAAIHISADHSNHVWLGDATPIQSIYIHEKNNRLVYDPSIAQDKNHGEDRRKRKKLEKVWMYFVVDKFSGAFVIRPYKGSHLGENPLHWIETYKYCMVNSDIKDSRIPLDGIPLNLYGDKGAMDSAPIKRFSEYFGINADWHLPGNSRASGAVESRISAVKRLYETLWNSAIMESDMHNSNFESFCEFIHEWMIECNESRGFYSRYKLGKKIRENVTEKHILTSLLEPEIRGVSDFGEITIDNKVYFVHSDIAKTKVTITRKYPDLVYATDYLGNIHECTDKLNSVGYGNFKAHEQTELQRNQQEVFEMAVDFKKNTSFEDLMPGKIIPLRKDDDSIYTVQKALDVFLDEIGEYRHNIEDETFEMFREYFREAIKKEAKISNAVMQKAIQIYNNNQQEANIGNEV